MIMFWSSIMASLLAVVGCGYVVAAAILVGRFARQRPFARRAFMPGVTILKPLHGAEPGLLVNLASFCAQDYPGRMQIVFGVQDAKDGAIAIVERLRSEHAARDLDLVVDATACGQNCKVSNLVNMSPSVDHDIIVLADSDMRVGPDYLSRVVAALGEPGVGGVTCLYHGVAATGLWARLCALGINAHFLPSVVVGLGLGLAHPCFGSTIAFRRDALAEIGGFITFADCLADDYAIGEALRAHGYKIFIPPFTIAHVCIEMSARELWQHELRWARTVRSIDPVGYTGSIVTHAFPWALIAMLLGAGSVDLGPAIGIGLASLACRLALLRQVERAFGLAPQAYWLQPVRDLLSFAIFATSLLSWDATWKGRRYRVVSGGTLVVNGGTPEP